MNIQELRKLLSNDIVTVTFTKKDGSTREMLCTTMKEYLPGEWLSSEEPLIPASQSVVTVWDLENQGWRSFKFDSVESIFADSYVAAG
jgi:hypothetical protein